MFQRILNMTNLTQNSDQNRAITLEQSGSVLLEFTLVLPLILGIIFASTEYIGALRITQFGTTISREASSMAFRECSGDIPRKIEGCLDLIRERIETFADKVEENTEVIISVYEFEDGKAVQLGMSKKSDGKNVSKFNINSPLVIGDGEILSSHKRLILAESFVPSRQIIKGIGFMKFSFSKYTHDVTVI